MRRLTSSSRAGITRKLVAVGTPRLAVMLATIRPAAPRSGVASSPAAPPVGPDAGPAVGLVGGLAAFLGAEADGGAGAGGAAGAAREAASAGKEVPFGLEGLEASRASVPASGWSWAV